MNLNDLLLREDIDPEQVLVLRHAPSKEHRFRKVLPWLAVERPDLYNAYQQAQVRPVAQNMATISGTGFIASFIGHEARKALFVGLYSIGESKPLTWDEFWNIPENMELKESFGMKGFRERQSSILWFDLTLTDFCDSCKGKLVVGWPNWPWGARVWCRWAHKNEFPVLEDSALDSAVP